MLCKNSPSKLLQDGMSCPRSKVAMRMAITKRKPVRHRVVEEQQQQQHLLFDSIPRNRSRSSGFHQTWGLCA